MKLSFSRIASSVAIAAATLLSVSAGAFAQTAPDYNYAGIGGSNDGFVVNGKLSVSDNVSIRPEVGTDFDFNDGEDISYLVPVTYDFNSVGAENYQFNPFLGAGVTGEVGDDSTAEFAVVAGADYRFAQKYVANGSVNYSPFADNDEIGFTVGVGRVF
jgi:hypothetical protein